MNNATFGSHLRQIRETKNISLRELAKRIGVSGAFLSDIELGRRFPASDKIKLLATELDVSLEELQKYDFRDEAEEIKKMMFSDPQAGMAFRTLKAKIQAGTSPDKIREHLDENIE